MVFDFKKSFEDRETWFVKQNHITRPMCRGKLLDIYATRIGPAHKYADALVKDMIGDDPTYRCTVCTSDHGKSGRDGKVCREGSNALREAYARLVYDMKIAKIAEENKKRQKELHGWGEAGLGF